MKTSKLFLFFVPLFLFLLLLSSCSTADALLNENTEQNLLNISYGSHPQQKFDLYLPANHSAASTKTIILVHGGGWTGGDKSDMNDLVSLIKQYLPGYAIANMNYRLATTGNPAFPMQLNDIQSVIEKLKNTAEYGISDNFGFIGTSAGGHLSLLYSYTNNADNGIKMVASIVGPTDFIDPNYTNDPALMAAFEGVAGVSYASNPAYYQQLSPLHRATATAPPTALFYGNADPLIPTTQGVNLHNKLNQLGVYNEFSLYQGGHGNWALNDQLDAYGKLVAFIQNRL